MYGADTGFDVERNINGVASYPNRDKGPAIDRYVCRTCGGEIRHTMDGVFMDFEEPERRLFLAITRHREFCATKRVAP
jgi:hypothetical protein